MSLRLDWCSHKAAKAACERWHYSSTIPTPPLLNVGVWEHGKFIGAVIFGRGANNNLGKPYGLQTTEVCELVRVALAEHDAPVSRILAIACKLLANAQRVRLVVSFADTNEGHHGGIYQAAGWLFSGTTPPSYKYRDARGREWHQRQVSVSGTKPQYGEMRAVAKISECTKIPQLGKHRYLMPLDPEMRARIEPLRKPYPKRPKQSIDALSDQLREGGEAPTRTLQSSEAPRVPA